MSGFASPNHTQTPNELFDLYMPLMHEAELKVVMAIVRKTLGYKKDRDPISITQLEKLTGLSRQGVLDGAQAAIDRGLVSVMGSGKRGTKIYGLVYCVDQSTEQTRTSQDSRPELVYSVDTQKKLYKRNSTKETKTLAVEVQPPADPIPQPSLPQSHDVPKPTMLKEVFKETPPVPPPPSLPDGYEWRCQDGTNHIVKLRKNAHHKGLCGAYAWAGNRGRGIFDCPDCVAKLAQLNKPKQPPQYGDLVVIVHKFGFNGADSNAAWGRAGDATKALLADDPTATPEEFQSFADYWIVLPGKPNFPCGADSLPANFAKWKAGLINGQTTGATHTSARTVTNSATGAGASITGEGSAGNGQVPKFAPADGTGRKPWERVAKSA
jgi:phage replication O-like protein O